MGPSVKHVLGVLEWFYVVPEKSFLAAGVTETKVRRSTGVTTVNSTNKYQKYKSVELGDQLHRVGSFLLLKSTPDFQIFYTFLLFWLNVQLSGVKLP